MKVKDLLFILNTLYTRYGYAKLLFHYAARHKTNGLIANDL